MHLLDPIIQQVLMTCLTAVTSATCAWVARTTKRTRDEARGRDEAMRIGLQTILRADILSAYRDHVQHGELLSFERKAELVAEHDAYVALGGNGTLGEHSTIWRDLDGIQAYDLRRVEDARHKPNKPEEKG